MPPPDEPFVGTPVAEAPTSAVSPADGIVARVSETLDDLGRARPDVVAAAIADTEDMDWFATRGAMSFRVTEVLRGAGLVVGRSFAVRRPPLGDERYVCERPHVRAGLSYVVALVRDPDGEWSFARDAGIGMAWAPVVTDDRGTLAAAFPRGAAVPLELLREGGR